MDKKKGQLICLHCHSTTGIFLRQWSSLPPYLSCLYCGESDDAIKGIGCIHPETKTIVRVHA